MNATHSFNIGYSTAFPRATNTDKWETSLQIADALNSGKLVSSSNKTLDDLGLFASGGKGTLTIAAADGDFVTTSGNLPTLTVGLGSVEANTETKSNASNIQIFTREGRHIAGSALTSAQISNLMTAENGFTAEAIYKGDFLNSKNNSYRGMNLETVFSSGMQSLQIGSNGIQAYASGAKTFVPASNVNAHTASITLGNGSTASASILNGSSAGEVSNTLNNVLSDIGASSTAYTIVDLKNFSGSGTVTFNIEGKNENPIQISANITSSNLSNLVLSINSQSSLTGIKATLSKDKDRVILNNEDGDDILISKLDSSSPSFTASVINDNGIIASSEVQMGINDSARFSGLVKLNSSETISYVANSVTSSSSQNFQQNGIINIKSSDSFEKKNVDFSINKDADKSSGSNNGSKAISASGEYSLTIPGINFLPQGLAAVSKTFTEIGVGTITAGSVTGTSAATSSTNYADISSTDTSGSGRGAVFDVVADGSGGYSVTLENPGVGYASSDTITIDGSMLGGNSGVNDLTFTVSSVVGSSSGSGTNASFKVVCNNGLYSATLLNPGNGYVNSERITIPGTALGGATPANDLILTFDNSKNFTTTVKTEDLETVDSKNLNKKIIDNIRAQAPIASLSAGQIAIKSQETVFGFTGSDAIDPSNDSVTMQINGKSISVNLSDGDGNGTSVTTGSALTTALARLINLDTDLKITASSSTVGGQPRLTLISTNKGESFTVNDLVFSDAANSGTASKISLVSTSAASAKPADGKSVFVDYAGDTYKITMEQGEVVVKDGEKDRVTAYFDGDGRLQIFGGGTLSGQEIKLSTDSKVPNNSTFAKDFGLISNTMQFSGQEYTLTSSVTSTKIDTNETGLTNGSYVVAQSSVVPSGGSGATFSVVVSGNKITNVTIQNSGTGYKTGDIITLNTSGITGGSSAAKLKITSMPQLNLSFGGSETTIDLDTSGNIITSGVRSVSINTNETGLTNGNYTVYQSSVAPSGGTGASFNVTVSGGTITSVTPNHIGSGYNNNDLITLNTSGITGGGSSAKVSVTTTSTPTGLTLAFNKNSGSSTVGRLSAKYDNSIYSIDFVKPESSLGFKTIANNLKFENDEISISTTDGSSANVSATSSSIAAQQVKISNLPKEELLILTTGTGARSFGTEFEFKTDEQIKLEKEDSYEVKVSSTDNSKLEIIDSKTGHSVASRTLSAQNTTSYQNLNLEFNGKPTLKDFYTIELGKGHPGDGRNLEAMIDLQDQVMNNQVHAGFTEMFTTIVAKVGNAVELSKMSKETAEAQMFAAKEVESEFSGVNLDTEAASLIEFQQAYQASARILSTARELFRTLIEVV